MQIVCKCLFTKGVQNVHYLHGHMQHWCRFQLEMWANAQRDGRPAEYRWRPVFNSAVWLTPTTRVLCSNAAKTRTRWNYLGCSKLTKWSQPLVGRSSPYYEDMYRRYCCLTSFFPIVDTCLRCEDIAQQSCGMVPRWRFLTTFFGSCICSEPRAAPFRPAF